MKELKVDMRWLNKVVGIKQNMPNYTPYTEGSILVEIDTSEGNYSLKTKYLIACDGSKSTIRNLMSLEMHGERFEERFLIGLDKYL